MLLAVAVVAPAAPAARAANAADPQADFKAFRDYFTKRFPKVPLNDFVNGPYSMDAGLRKQWIEIDAFPPYQFALDKGKQMFETPFPNGKTYADCFPNKGIGIRQNYPYFDAKSGEVITLDVALNQCRQQNGAAAARLHQGRHGGAHGLYGLHVARQTVRHQDPERSARTRRLPEGRGIFLHPARPAQLLLRELPRAERRATTSAPKCWLPRSALVAALPIYRSEWGGMGTTSRRLTSCNSQVRGVPLKPEDELYRDVEYYLSYMSNGLPISGPGARP